MFEGHALLTGLGWIASLGLAGWIFSLERKCVNVVDVLWSLFFVSATLNYFSSGQGEPRSLLMLALTMVWGIRLSLYLVFRNWGKSEDRRYQKIRLRNSPWFGLKSIYLIFGIQVLLAWIISLPQFSASFSTRPLNAIDYIGASLWLFGWSWETIADCQLALFKSRPEHHDLVMKQGLWQFSRHPNYFGECCLWWGFYLIAAAGGGWWTFISPSLMTLLLLKVSGVPMLERELLLRRPDYVSYIAHTNAMVPWFSRPARRMHR